MQTLVLSVNLDGSKNLPCLVFKGKGKTPEGKQLQSRDDILVFFSDNGWMNGPLTEKWVGKIFPHESDKKKLLIWDSFKCHIDENIKGLLHDKNVFSAIIPGGYTSQIQTLDVCINRPFKSRMEELFDEFMADESQHSFTRGGNMKAASMTQICNMVVRAWEDITPDIIIKSFKVCGQSPDTEVGDILAFRDGMTCTQGRQNLEYLWSVPIDFIDLNLLFVKEMDESADATLYVAEENGNNDQSEENDDIFYPVAPLSF